MSAPVGRGSIAAPRTPVRPIETTVDLMCLPTVDPVSMPSERTSAGKTFRSAERAMSQLAVLGMLVGVAFVLAGALAAFMLLGT